MSLKTVKRLNEGPLDFLRGAGREAGRQVANSGVGRAVGDMVQAGKAASAEGNARKQREQLTAAITQLGQMVVQLQTLQGQPSDENPQDEQRQNPMPADNGQQPAQQQTDNVQSGPASAQPGAQSSVRRLTPKMAAARGLGQNRPRRVGESVGSFEMFLSASFNDNMQLDEGVWDFLKGAGQEGARKVLAKWQDAGKNSTLAQMYRAGMDAHESGKVKSLEKKVQAQVAAIKQMIATMGPQGWPIAKEIVASLPQAEQQAVFNTLR